jgi:hypothetical protein
MGGWNRIPVELRRKFSHFRNNGNDTPRDNVKPAVVLEKDCQNIRSDLGSGPERADAAKLAKTQIIVEGSIFLERNSEPA